MSHNITFNTSYNLSPEFYPRGDRDATILDYIVSFLFLVYCIPSFLLYGLIAMIIVVRFKQLGSNFYILIVALTVPDMIALGLQIFYAVPCTWLQRDVSGHYLIEYGLGFISHCLWFIQIGTLLLTGVNRLMCISAKSFDYFDRVFTKFRLLLAVALIWLAGIILTSLTAILSCFSSYHYEAYYWGYICFDKRRGPVGDWLNFLVSNSVVVMCFWVYIVTWYRVRQSNKNITSGTRVDEFVKRKRAETKMVAQCAAMMVCLTLLELSFYIIPRILSGAAISMVISFAYLSFCGNNAYIYAIMNVQIRSQIWSILTGVKIAPDTGIGQNTPTMPRNRPPNLVLPPAMRMVHLATSSPRVVPVSPTFINVVERAERGF